MDIDAMKAHTLRYWSEATDTHIADPAYYRLAASELKGILARHLHGGNVLDIGCGNGEYTALIAERAGRVLAFDVSEGLLAGARQRCADLRKVSFFAANVTATKLAFPHQADAVFCMGVLACLPDDAQMDGLVDDFADYLVDGGLLVLRESTVRGGQQYVRYPNGHLGCYRNKDALLEALSRRGFALTEDIPLKAEVEPFNDYLVLHRRQGAAA